MAQARNVVYPLRMDAIEKKLFDLAAKARGIPLSKWVRGYLLDAAISDLGEQHGAVKAYRKKDLLPNPTVKHAKKGRSAKKGTKP